MQMTVTTLRSLLREMQVKGERSREMVNIARTELNGLYAEMRQLRNEVHRVRNRTHRLDTDHGHYTDDFSDEELDMNNMRPQIIV